LDRVIFLVDMNAFYITCETTRNPELAGRPAAVAGDPKRRSGIILAANYPARALGVRTAMVLRDALRLCPQLALVPPDHDFYEQKSAEVMSLLGGYSPLLEQNSIDEAWLDMSGCERLWGPPRLVAQQIMDRIKDELGLWCSIGIAPNKFLAKMASEMKKPLGITCLDYPDLPERYWPLPVRALSGVGASTADKLVGMGVRTIGDLARLDPAFLARRFGRQGQVLHDHAWGRDDAPVTPHEPDEAKSIGRSTTLSRDVTDRDEACRILMALTDDVAASMRRHQKRGTTVQITLKFHDFSVITRQARIQPTCATREIYTQACHLLDQHWDRTTPIRLIGVSVSGFRPDCADQLTLFDLEGAAARPGGLEKQDKLDRAIDDVRSRFGSASVTYGKLIEDKSRSKETPD